MQPSSSAWTMSVPESLCVDIAFAVSLPSDLQRFLPLARRLPGSEFILAPGRWPSTWLDSRRWTQRQLQQQQLRPVRAQRQFSLLVAGPGIGARALRPWRRAGGRVLRWSPRLAERFGDPRLESSAEPGAAARARARLGADRPLWLVVIDECSASSERCFAQLAGYRGEAELVVVASERAWLRSPRPFPSVLRGPGVQLMRESSSWPDLLAAADLVLGSDRIALREAIEVAIPALYFAMPQTAVQRQGEGNRERALLDLLPIVFEPQALAPQLRSLRQHWQDRESARAQLLTRPAAAKQLAQALARLQARIAIERTLRSIL